MLRPSFGYLVEPDQSVGSTVAHTKPRWLIRTNCDFLAHPGLFEPTSQTSAGVAAIRRSEPIVGGAASSCLNAHCSQRCNRLGFPRTMPRWPARAVEPGMATGLAAERQERRIHRFGF